MPSVPGRIVGVLEFHVEPFNKENVGKARILWEKLQVYTNPVNDPPAAKKMFGEMPTCVAK